MNYTEAISLARQGREEGFKHLYEETYQKSYYIALKYMKQEEAAMDVLQDAYIKAFDSLEQLQDAEKFPAWFGRIVASKALDALKKKRVVLFSEMGEEDDNTPEEIFREERLEYQPEMSMEQAETSRLVKEMIDSLSDEQRLCILMFYIEQMSVKEIAGVLNVSENTVKSRLNYGRKNIKDKVLELEKNGTKLYGIAPIPLLVYLLLSEANTVQAAPSMEAMMSTVINAGVQASTGVSVVSATVEGASGATASMTGNGVVSAGVIGKVLAAVGGTAVVTAGIVTAVVLSVGGNKDNNETVPGYVDTYEDSTSESTNDIVVDNTDNTDDTDDTDDAETLIWDFGNFNLVLIGDTVYVRGTGEVSPVGTWLTTYGENADHVVIEEGIESLASGAFGNVEGYETLTMADSVTYMGAATFENSSFSSIKLSENITEIPDSAYARCNNLTEIEIPSSIQTISGQAFYESNNLTKITLPGNAIIENGELFYGLTSISQVVICDGAENVNLFFDGKDVSIQIPSTATTIRTAGVGRIYGEEGSYAHHYATMEGIEFWVGDIDDEDAYLAGDYIMRPQWPQCPDVSEDMEEASNSLQAYTIIRNNSLICIGKGEYEYRIDVNVLDKECEYLYIADGVTGIGRMSFLSYSNLQYAQMADSVTYIGESAFKGTTDLREIKLSAGLEAIGENAFYESGLTFIEIPGSVESIDEYAFSRCTYLKYVKFEEGLKTIGDAAFSQTSLTKVYLPDGFESIGSGAFNSCSELVEVRIPDSVTYIADNAFVGCGTTYQEKSDGESYLKIIGKKGSYAETYAIEKGIDFVEE